MELITYLNKLTKDGTSVLLGKNEHQQTTTTTMRDEFGNGVEVVTYKSISISEGKRQEEILRQVCWAVLNNRDPMQWFNYCKRICSKQFESSDTTGVKELYDAILTTIAYKIGCGAYDEHSFPGGTQLFKMLTTRIDAWQKQAVIESKTDGATSVTVNFGSWN